MKSSSVVAKVGGGWLSSAEASFAFGRVGSLEAGPGGGKRKRAGNAGNGEERRSFRLPVVPSAPCFFPYPPPPPPRSLCGGERGGGGQGVKRNFIPHIKHKGTCCHKRYDFRTV